jgi:hypothetical protein
MGRRFDARLDPSPMFADEFDEPFGGLALRHALSHAVSPDTQVDLARARADMSAQSIKNLLATDLAAARFRPSLNAAPFGNAHGQVPRHRGQVESF